MICLKWNTYHTNIQNILPSLLEKEQYVDVTLATQGRYIKCHKVILSACSPYLHDLLLETPCQHPIILMKDLEFWEIRALVEFMYCGEVSVEESNLPSLLKAAQALHVKEDGRERMASEGGGEKRKGEEMLYVGEWRNHDLTQYQEESRSRAGTSDDENDDDDGDSEQEKYTFNMDRSMETDDSVATRKDMDSLTRIHDFVSNTPCTK